MLITVLRPLALLFCLGFMACWTADEDLAPGAHKKLPCPGAADQDWDAYIPKAYAEEKDTRFPVLFISGAGGNPGFLNLSKWAERQNVILVTINKSQNGEWPPIIAAQKAVTAAAFARLRIHPCLRFSIGHSGAAYASAKLASAWGDAWGGVVHCINSQREIAFKKHIACAYIAGTKDDVYSINDVRADAAKAKAAGNPVKVIERPVGHAGMTPEDMSDCLDWMLELQRLVHPGLTPVERKANAERLKGMVVATKAIPDPAERLASAKRLMDIEQIAKLPEARGLAEARLSALLATTDDTKDPIAAHRALDESSRAPWAGAADAETRKTLGKRITALLTQPAVKADRDSRLAFDQAEAMEKKAGTSRTMLQAVVTQYVTIAKRWPDTDAGKAARQAAEQLAVKIK